jgi:hypothetical protein
MPHLNIPTGTLSDELDKNISERSLFYFYVNETDTVTSGLRWIFLEHIFIICIGTIICILNAYFTFER